MMIATRRSRRISLLVASVILTACVSACGGGNGSLAGTPVPPPGSGPEEGPAECVGGVASQFSCSGIDLRHWLDLSELEGTLGSDIWGWADPLSGEEYALVALSDGVSFVNVSDPDAPLFVGKLPTLAGTSPWRDIKVYEDHAFVVADLAGTHGMQVFDLTRLADAVPPATFAADAIYGDFLRARNLAIDEETGFAFVAGTNTCGGGLHIVDIRTPGNPMFAGCHLGADANDAQCVVYRGPNPLYVDRELCFVAHTDFLEVVDVTLKLSTVSLGTLVYPQLGAVNQGWLTPDQRYFLVSDDADETRFGVPTRTHVIDVSNPQIPRYVFPYEAATDAIDHNLYIDGNLAFLANYESGLRVVELGDLLLREMSEIAYFDTYPQGDGITRRGAFSVYPFLPSGNLIVSDTQNGLFVLTLQP